MPTRDTQENVPIIQGSARDHSGSSRNPQKNRACCGVGKKRSLCFHGVSPLLDIPSSPAFPTRL